MSEVSHVQWFPGHMAKTRRIMADASGFLLILATFILFLRRMRMWSMNIQLLEII